MRQAGYESFPTPPLDDDGRVDITGINDTLREDGYDPSSVQFSEAADECSIHLGGLSVYDSEAIADMEAELTVFAECMRKEGIDVPDPDLSSVMSSGKQELESRLAGGPELGVFGDVTLNYDDPETALALETCGPLIGLPLPGER